MLYSLTDCSNLLLRTDIINSLKDRRIETVFDFLEKPSFVLAELTGLNFMEILTIKKKITEKYSSVTNGYDYVQNLKTTTAIIPTKIKNLDDLLDGGLRSRYLYEICGYSGSGKSYLCRRILLNLVQHFSLHALFVDTTNNIDINWIFKELKKNSSSSIANMAKNINFLTILSDKNLIEFLLQLKVGYGKKSYKYRIIIIDSLPAIFNISSEPSSYLYNINVMASLMKFLANKYNLIIVCVNLMTKWQEYDFNKGNYTVQNVVDRSTLTLGQQWKFVPNVRLLMENIVKDQTRRKVTLIKSSNLIIDHTCVIENY